MQVAQPLMRPPGLNLPRRERRVSRFSMTALADVLFQLLIFFMLSSNPSAYAMLPLRSGALQGEGGAEPAGAGTNVTGTETTAVWTLNIDGITASGQRFAISRLPALARALSMAAERAPLEPDGEARPRPLGVRPRGDVREL